MSGSQERLHDLIVVGAGPTGIAIGAEAKGTGLDVLLIDRGPVVANLLGFPTNMTFFTTRDLLEVAGVPFAIPQEKPDRRQAVAYYHSIARQFELEFALHEEVVGGCRDGGIFVVETVRAGNRQHRRTRALALATGYFHHPRKLGVPGEEQGWVHSRYLEPYRHFRESVVVVGGGNSALETALDLWRNGVDVTVIHRGNSVKSTVKYWLRPDFENRVQEGSIALRLNSRVDEFGDRRVELVGPAGRETLRADAAYVMIGYEVDVDLERGFGIEIDAETWVPTFDAETCETNVAGLYVAGTLQAGRDTGKIFIENSRDHGQRIVRHLARRLGRPVASAS